jgi:hypothetical protein
MRCWALHDPVCETFQQNHGYRYFIKTSTPRPEIRRKKLENIDFVLATPSNIMPARQYDLWFSRLVLQHDSPPVTLAILRSAFRNLMPDGVAIIHVPTFMHGYTFRSNKYINRSSPPEMEMHTPARFIFETAFQHYCCLSGSCHGCARRTWSYAFHHEYNDVSKNDSQNA